MNKREPHVVMITPQWLKTIGGPTRTVKFLTDYLRGEGYRISVLTSDGGEGGIHLNGRFLPKEWEAFKILKRLRPDIVHIHGRVRYILPAALYRISVNHNARIAFTFHTQPYLQDFLPRAKQQEYPGKDYAGIKKIIAKLLLSRCDRVVTVSGSIIKNLNELCGLGIKKFTVIPSGTEIRPPTDLKERVEEFKAGHNLQGCYPILSTVGVFTWDWKVVGLEVCIRAIRILKDKHPDVRLLIAGDGPYRQHLLQLVNDLGLRREVIFLGNLKDVTPLLYSSDLYVHMALNEGSSLAIAEAMGAGRCVIGARRGGIPESIRDNETGVLIEPEPMLLADAIDQLLNDHVRRAMIEEKAYEYAKNEISWPAICRAYQKLYLEISM